MKSESEKMRKFFYLLLEIKSSAILVAYASRSFLLMNFLLTAAQPILSPLFHVSV